MKRKLYYATMPSDGPKVLLPIRSENSGPKDYFHSPTIDHGGQMEVIPQLQYSKQPCPGNYSMVCAPASENESNFIKGESFESCDLRCPQGMSISAETYGGVEVFANRNQGSLRMCYDSTTEHVSQNYGWMFGTLPTSAGYTKNALWWGRLAYQGEAVRLFSTHYESFTQSEQRNCFAELAMNYAKDGRASIQEWPRLGLGRSPQPWKVRPLGPLWVQPLHDADAQRASRRPLRRSLPAPLWRTLHVRPLHAPHAQPELHRQGRRLP